MCECVSVCVCVCERESVCARERDLRDGRVPQEEGDSVSGVPEEALIGGSHHQPSPILVPPGLGFRGLWR